MKVLSLLFFFMLAWPLFKDGRSGSSLPLANDIALPGFVAMDKTGDAPESSFELAMWLEHPLRLGTSKSVSLKFGTYFKTIAISSAELEQAGSHCRLVLDSPVELADGGVLKLRSTDCDWSKTSNFKLRVSGPGIDGLAVLGYPAVSKTQFNPEIYALSKDGQKLAVTGNFQPAFSSPMAYMPRVKLLAHMWNWSHDWAAFAICLLLALAAVSFGFASLIWSSRKGRESSSWQFTGTAVLLILALQVSYAFLSPPFQAPDEADHFLTFSRVGGLTNAELNGLQLANQGHFDRLMCHVSEKYTKVDFQHPMQQPKWNEYHIGYVDVAPRSAYANVVWPLVARFLFQENSSPETVHLGLRLFNGLYFSLVFLISLGLFRRIENFDKLDALGCLIVVPTLFHFSNHNSNHAFIISHYIPFVLAFRPFVTGRLLNIPILLWIGMNLGLSFLSGRLGLIFSLVIYGSLVIRGVWIGSDRKNPILRGLTRLWVDFFALAVPVGGLVVLFWNSPYISNQLGSVSAVTGLGEGGILIALAALLIGPVAGFLAGRLMEATSCHPLAARWTRNILWLGFAVAVGLFFLPMFAPLPPLMNIEFLQNPLTDRQYVRKVLKHFVASWGWWGKDFYLIESFWGGFACPEPVIRDSVVQLIKGGLAGLLAWGTFKIAKKSDWRLGAILVLSLGLLTIYLALLAYGAAAQPSNLHGRYMVGFYLLLIQTIALSTRSNASSGSTHLMPVAFLAGALIHIVSVGSILDRYF